MVMVKVGVELRESKDWHGQVRFHESKDELLERSGGGMGLEVR
jgi:hypothetical protein